MRNTHKELGQVAFEARVEDCVADQRPQWRKQKRDLKAVYERIESAVLATVDSPESRAKEADVRDWSIFVAAFIASHPQWNISECCDAALEVMAFREEASGKNFHD